MPRTPPTSADLHPGDLAERFEREPQRKRPELRRELGQYFTPAPIVDCMWRLALERFRELGLKRERLRVVDPAVGAGAFLMGAHRAGVSSDQLLGVEVDPAALRAGSREVIGAWRRSPTVILADSLEASTEDRLVGHLCQGDGALVIGNPPYNGASPLLADRARYTSVQERLLPYLGGHRPRSGFRDDFAFFLAMARRVVARSGRPGVVCFILPQTLLDAFDYQGVRRELCAAHRVQVLDVGSGAFDGARVSTAIVMLSPGHGVTHQARVGTNRVVAQPATRGTTLSPGRPAWILRPQRDLRALLSETDPLTDLLQRWFTPHKTGFDELLVAGSPEELLARLGSIKRASRRFASVAVLDELHPALAGARLSAKVSKVLELVRHLPGFPEPARVRPYLRFNPRSAHFFAPADQWRWVYFDHRISTLFNHAFSGMVGTWDPHATKPQLLFNTLESRSYGMVVMRPGVVHLYQHTRFAPLRVPTACWEARGRPVSAPQDRGRMRLNFTSSGAERARLLNRPVDLFHLAAGLANSALVQRIVAPETGTQAALPVPRLEANAALAQTIARMARSLALREDPSVRHQLNRAVVTLYAGRANPAPWMGELGLHRA